MKSRKGERIGWLGGWLGGFLWLCLLSILWLVQGKLVNGLAGMGLFLVALCLIIVLGPWKHPETRYWKLMLPIYLVFLAAVSLFVWLGGGIKQMGLNWWSLLWLLPIFIPFGTMSSRRWCDGA